MIAGILFMGISCLVGLDLFYRILGSLTSIGQLSALIEFMLLILCLGLATINFKLWTIKQSISMKKD